MKAKALSYLPKAEADNTNRGLDSSLYHATTELRWSTIATRATPKLNIDTLVRFI